MEKKVRKPSGWKGKKADLFWTKDSAYGVKYMCSFCGRAQLGMSYGNNERHHWRECSYLKSLGAGKGD